MKLQAEKRQPPPFAERGRMLFIRDVQAMFGRDEQGAWRKSQWWIPVTIHDLRRLFIQVGVDEVGEQQAQKAVGHRTREMTRRYANRKDKGLVAGAVGSALLSARPREGKKTRKSRGTFRGRPVKTRPRRAS